MIRIPPLTTFAAFAALCLASLIATLTPQPAEAQRPGSLPYCATFSDGVRDCSYPTLKACRTAIRGAGGSCSHNPRGPNGLAPPNFLQRMMGDTGSAYGPAYVGPPPDSRMRRSARRQGGNVGRYCASSYDGGWNCGYPTLAACRAAIRGPGGSCHVNPAWR